MFQYYLIMLHMFANSSINLNKQSSEYVRIMENNRQKQSSRGVLRKWCSKNKQQIYRRTPIPKCDFNNMQSNFIEITLRHGCSPVNLHIFRIPFPNLRMPLDGCFWNTSQGFEIEWVKQVFIYRKNDQISEETY